MNSADPAFPNLKVEISQVGEWTLPLDLLIAGVKRVLTRAQVPHGEISLTFLDDEGIQAMNREYLGKNRTTDVIAFALNDDDSPLLGDVYVGYDQAQRQAGEEGVPLQEELLRLAIHGALHVLGYEHPQGEDRMRSEMFDLQEEILRETLSPG